MNSKKKDCIFCQVARKEIEHHQFWEDKHHSAFLDANPQVFGHSLVIPKQHIGYVFDLGEKDYIKLLKASEKVARMLQKATKCKRVCMGIYGFEVNHIHVHLWPVNRHADLHKKIKKPSQKKQEEFSQKLKMLQQ